MIEQTPGKTGHVYQSKVSHKLYLCFHYPDIGQRLLCLDAEYKCNPLASETSLWGLAGPEGYYHVGKFKGARV